MNIKGDNMKIFCIGNVSYDITMPMDDYPEENVKYRSNDRVECGGGPPSNAAYLLGKWKIDTSFIGAVGDDDFGKRIKQEFKAANVNTSYITTCRNVKTTLSLVIPNTKNGSRTIITNRSTNLKLNINNIKETPDIILMDGDEFECSNILIEKFPDAVTIIDANKVNDEIIDLGKKVKYFICSKTFAENYTNLKFNFENNESVKEIFKKLKEDFDNEVIVTLEDRGALYLFENELRIMPSIKVNTIDSTGAGDIFHGAFAYCLAKNYDLEKSIKISNIAGALSTKTIGTRNSIPNLDEVMSIYERL